MMRPILYALLLFPAAPARAAAPGNTVAVLSVVDGAYLEAFSSFQAVYGEVPYYNLSREKPAMPPGTSLVAAFGGKAANFPYPPGVNLVYCLAPGISIKNSTGERRTVKISMLPRSGLLISGLKDIQPGLKRLRVFWMAPDFRSYMDLLKKEGEAGGMAVDTVKIEGAEDLPGLLRRSAGRMDAFWLPPDPLLVTRENMLIFREFSLANGIPFYGSTKGMTLEGAVASIGVSFREIGRAAAMAARSLDAGETLPEAVFPEKTETTLNAAAAKKCGIVFPRAVLDEAGYLFP